MISSVFGPDDAEDRRELDAVRAEGDYVPWDEVKAALELE